MLDSIKKWRERFRAPIQEMSRQGLWIDAWVVETPPISRVGRSHRFLVRVHDAESNRYTIASIMGSLCYTTEDGEQLAATVHEELVDEQGRRYWRSDPASVFDLPGFIVHLLISGSVPLSERLYHPPHDRRRFPKIYTELRRRLRGPSGNLKE